VRVAGGACGNELHLRRLLLQWLPAGTCRCRLWLLLLCRWWLLLLNSVLPPAPPAP
jgi:hypothetical protein